jgi:hypothetical protein
MAMNWGLALGKAFETGLNTYERLGEEELRQLQRDELKRKIAEEQALNEKFAQTYGRVGQADDYGVAIQKASGNQGIDMGQAKALSAQGALPGNTAGDQAFERASAEAAAGAMRENAARQGKIPEAEAALPTMAPQEYTNRQAMADYTKAAAGVSRKGYIEALGMKKEARASEIDDKFDEARSKLDDTLARIHGTAESGGLKGLAEAAKKEGIKVEYVEGKNGIGKINILGPKGDVLESVSSVADATSKLEQAAMQHFQTQAVGLLGGADKLLTYMNQREEIGIKRQTAKTEEEFKGKGGVYEKVHMAAINAQQGKTPTAVYNEKVNVLAQNLMDAEPGKYKNMAEAKVAAAKLVLKAPADIKETTSGNYIVGNKVYRIDPKTNQAVEIQGFGTNSLIEAFANANPDQQKTTKTAAIPVQSAGAKQMDKVASAAGWKPMGKSGDMYFKTGPNGEPIHRTGEQLAKELGVLY